MSYTFSGTLKVKKDVHVVSDKFKKRDFVVTSNDVQYPQEVTFQLAQDRCIVIDGMEIGAKILVHFDLRGREWTDPKSGEIKHFNTINAWRVELTSSAEPMDTKAGMSGPEDGSFESEDDDFPF